MKCIRSLSGSPSCRADHSTSVASRVAWPFFAGLLGLGAATLPSYAAQPLAVLYENGTPILDARLRYENVDDASKAFDANAVTLRARAGYATGSWNGLSALAELDQVWVLDGDYNSTRNGKIADPAVADPAMTALNRLQLTYAPGFGTQLILGRQRIVLGNQRFVGNAGWRQHEQTFDALTAINTSVDGLTLAYSYLDRVNRVFGPRDPVPAAGPSGAFHCDCHLIDGVYGGMARLKLQGFAYLLDLSQKHGSAGAKLATSKLSTATLGLRAEYDPDVTQDLSARIVGAFAHQTGYWNNPLQFGLDYWQGEASATYEGLTGLVGYEAMHGNGAVGFSTPLATVHAFDGWADMFLTTPANGLNNLYFEASYAVPYLPAALDIKSITATVIHRDFSADKVSAGLGTEWDGAVEVAIDKRASLLVQYADYQGSGIGLGGFADKSILWFQASFKI